MRARLYSSWASSTCSLPSALPAWRGEDVEDHRRCGRRPASRAPASRLRSWRARQLVVAGDQVGVARSRASALASVDLAGAEVGVGVRLLAALDQLPHDRHAGRAQQLAQLGEVVVRVRRRRDAERALARALRGLGSVGARPRTASRPDHRDRCELESIHVSSCRTLLVPDCASAPSRCDRLEQALVGCGQRDPEPALARRPVDAPRARARRPACSSTCSQ